jgi:hypothetical protein
MFAGKDRSLPLSGAHESALTENIRLGWKSLPGANTLAYYKNLKIKSKKVLKHWPLGQIL